MAKPQVYFFSPTDVYRSFPHSARVSRAPGWHGPSLWALANQTDKLPALQRLAVEWGKRKKGKQRVKRSTVTEKECDETVVVEVGPALGRVGV